MSLISEAGSQLPENNEILRGLEHEPERGLPLEERAILLARFQQIRQETENLTTPLTAEDMQLQSMPDASPTKWHLAHTSWFFETFLLRSLCAGYTPFDPAFHHIFNSYYNTLGKPFARPHRGLLSRPSIEQIFSYRKHIDRSIERWLCTGNLTAEQAKLLLLGINHEQQHQELLLTDIKHAFSINPIAPAYREDSQANTLQTETAATLHWLNIPEDNYTIGCGEDLFSFDNEGPAHQRYTQAFRLASRLITNGEYLAFVEEGGYKQPRLWLSDGWARVQQERLQAPLYWRQIDGDWYEFTLTGLRPINLDAPVCHVNFYEADAFASWAGRRLPTEFEWEIAAWLYRNKCALEQANFLENRNFHPQTEAESADERVQLLGNLWQWTASAYSPYPGFRASRDAVGEYNGKFMCNQMVLRGGSCVTPQDHIRISYRNFFYPHQAWQFSGIRLAGDER